MGVSEGTTGVVFVSYAHEDGAVLGRLIAVLRPLVRKAQLELWADRYIEAGRAWRDEIELHLARAEVAVGLVSVDLLASDYVMEQELPRLVERGIPLLCVPVGPSPWWDIETLSSVHWTVPPERPLSAMTPAEQDSALIAVYEAVSKHSTDLTHVRPTVPREGTSGAVAPVLKQDRVGALVRVPLLPDRFFDRREELAALKANLQGSSQVGRRPLAGLQGTGGVGKSVLAAAICHDPEVRSWFPDGIYWVALGEDPDVLAAQQGLARSLGEDSTFSTLGEGYAALRASFAAR